MARSFTTASDALRFATSIVSGLPFSAAIKFRMLDQNNSGLDHCLLGFFNATTANGFFAEVSAISGVNGLRVATRASGISSASAGTTNQIFDNQWHWGFAQWTSTTSRSGRLDMNPFVTNTDTRASPTLGKSLIGARDDNGTLSRNIGHIIEQVGLWSDVGLTDADWSDLYYGQRPIPAVRTTSLIAHVDLRGGNMVDLLGNRSPNWSLLGPPAPAEDSPPNELASYFFAGFPAPTGQIKTVNSLAIASVKTMNGLAKASIKTANGLTP